MTKQPLYKYTKVKAPLPVALFSIVAILAFLPSCKPENLKEGAQKEYFDLKGYFEKNIAQLKGQHKKISKTVVHNGVSETRDVEVNNWEAELGAFTESDINKPAWSGIYTKKDSAGAIVYTATDLDLKTRRIIIDKTSQGKIQHIFIYNEVNNALYNTREELNYYPDSVYSINKYQKVKLLGANTYKITGKF
ncbi:hypothetical protein [Mucilaginibacter auburnensis]|uniref:Uncharacterized protein n=1 Tax=Mucilaginibacter auburnensis TaxID=1457233 RepID=A0A2H9VMN8_9SPHI|nr:hypothetical protein [Mucilaginibacter auburnensis]PJJ79592.1 hypothetical protein CLV57_2726 [Mucilaginibacter auburnensis]